MYVGVNAPGCVYFLDPDAEGLESASRGKFVLIFGEYLFDDECDSPPVVLVLCIDGCPCCAGMPPPLLVAICGIAPGAVVMLWICGLPPVAEDD